MKVSTTFEEAKSHRAKISSIKYAGIEDNEQFTNIVLTASEDKTIKLWDRRYGKVVAELNYQNQPFYSLDTNKSMICAGTNSEMIFWDLKKMKMIQSYLTLMM